jgi:hypothetical protein
MSLALIAAVGLTGATALAQGQGPQVKYKKETRYDFDDDLVEGELLRPEGDFIGTRRGARHSSLIKVRENFIPEMLKSAEDI